MKLSAVLRVGWKPPGLGSESLRFKYSKEISVQGQAIYRRCVGGIQEVYRVAPWGDPLDPHRGKS